MGRRRGSLFYLLQGARDKVLVACGRAKGESS